MTTPFENQTWIRNMISTGAITPPQGETRRSERLMHLYVFGFLIAGGLFFWLGMGFR